MEGGVGGGERHTDRFLHFGKQERRLAVLQGTAEKKTNTPKSSEKLLYYTDPRSIFFDYPIDCIPSIGKGKLSGNIVDQH